MGMIKEKRSLLNRFPIRRSEWDRFREGKRWFFSVVENERLASPLCLDVGSGARPFPYSNVVCDLYLKPTPQRGMKELDTEGKPFVLCDVHFLPFKTQAFDFVTCHYVFEHIDDPKRLYSEMRRVSKHGYIQSPAWFNEEILYGEHLHKWVMIVKNGKLHYRPVWKSLRPLLPFDYIFQRLYKRFFLWRLVHAIMDELLNPFTTRYYF